MKWFLILLFTVGLCGQTIQQRHLSVIKKRVAAGGGCTVLQYTTDKEDKGDYHLGYSYTYLASAITTVGAFTPCSLSVIGEEYGTCPAQVWNAQIWTESEGEPDAQVGSSESNNIDPTLFPSSDTSAIGVDWTSAPTLSATTNYFIVFVSSNTDGDFTNHAEIVKSDNETIEGIFSSTDGSTWIELSATVALAVELFSE